MHVPCLASLLALVSGRGFFQPPWFRSLFPFFFFSFRHLFLSFLLAFGLFLPGSRYCASPPFVSWWIWCCICSYVYTPHPNHGDIRSFVVIARVCVCPPSKVCCIQPTVLNLPTDLPGPQGVKVHLTGGYWALFIR